MPMTEQSVRVVKFEAKVECFGCDKSCGVDECGVQIEVKLPWPLGSKRYHLHISCGADLRDLIDRRLKEASKGIITSIAA